MYCPFILVDVCVACVFYKVAHDTNLFMHSELFCCKQAYNLPCCLRGDKSYQRCVQKHDGLTI